MRHLNEPTDCLKRFPVYLHQEQVLVRHAAGKYMLVPWGGQVLACSVMVQFTENRSRRGCYPTSFH
jgi:hypothetical protein